MKLSCIFVERISQLQVELGHRWQKLSGISAISTCRLLQEYSYLQTTQWIYGVSGTSVKWILLVKESRTNQDHVQSSCLHWSCMHCTCNWTIPMTLLCWWAVEIQTLLRMLQISWPYAVPPHGNSRARSRRRCFYWRLIPAIFIVLSFLFSFHVHANQVTILPLGFKWPVVTSQ